MFLKSQREVVWCETSWRKHGTSLGAVYRICKDKAILGTPITASEYRLWSVLVEADIVKCR